MGELAQATPIFLFIAKGVILLFLGIYIIFAVVVLRQIGLMTTTLKVGLEGTLKVFGYLHLILAIGLFLIALLLL